MRNIIDMVGGKNAKFWQEEVSTYYASNIVDKVWNTAHKIGYSTFLFLKLALKLWMIITMLIQLLGQQST